MSKLQKSDGHLAALVGGVEGHFGLKLGIDFHQVEGELVLKGFGLFGLFVFMLRNHIGRAWREGWGKFRGTPAIVNKS